MKAFLTSKRVWIAAGVLITYFATNPEAIAQLGVPAAWQTRIVALLALGTKVYDQMTKTA